MAMQTQKTKVIIDSRRPSVCASTAPMTPDVEVHRVALHPIDYFHWAWISSRQARGTRS
jgi:hypothetical protein